MGRWATFLVCLALAGCDTSSRYPRTEETFCVVVEPQLKTHLVEVSIALDDWSKRTGRGVRLVVGGKVTDCSRGYVLALDRDPEGRLLLRPPDWSK